MINKCVGTIGTNEGCLEQIRHMTTELSAYPSRFSPSISQGKPSPETQPDHSSPPERSPTAFPWNSLRTFSLAATSLCKVCLSKSDLVPTVHLQNDPYGENASSLHPADLPAVTLACILRLAHGVPVFFFAL